MKKIVILGCENSHADTFLKFIKEDEKYNDVEVLGVYSDEAEPVKKLQDKFGVAALKSFDEGVGKVDGVIVTARRGKDHYRFVKPYIASGVPVFIDKPITYEESEAIEMVKEFKKHGVKMTGGSSCVHVDWVQQLKRDREADVGGKTIGGYVRCPVSLKNAYGDFYFYCEHLIGIVSTIFGFYPESVATYKNEGNVTVVFRYKYYDVTGMFVDGNYIYYAMRSSTDGVKGETFPIESNSPCFKTEFNEFYELLNGANQSKSYEDFIAPVFVMNAIKRSLDSGKEEKVNKFEL